MALKQPPQQKKHIPVHIYMGVSLNNGTPKSSILIGFSIINHPFWGTHHLRKHPYGDPCVNPPIFRRAQDAACSKPGVHVSESPGRFCSCDKAPFGWCGVLGGPGGLGVVCHVTLRCEKATAPNSQSPPTKTGSHFFGGGGGGWGGFGGRFYVGWWVFERMLKEKKTVNWFCKILWWKEIQVIRKNWLMIDCVFYECQLKQEVFHPPQK